MLVREQFATNGTAPGKAPKKDIEQRYIIEEFTNEGKGRSSLKLWNFKMSIEILDSK